jgi:hypothetical protein
MMRTAIILLLLTGAAEAREPFCYRSGLLCDCVTKVCEGDNFRKPLPPGAHMAGDRYYVDKRCDGAGRYEAMREGSDCFNPPRDTVVKRPLPDGAHVNITMHRVKHHRHRSADDIRHYIDTHYPPVDFNIGARM